MSGNDPSHDMAHVERVVRMTHHLAQSVEIESGIQWTELHMLTMTLAALLHDVKDFKYSGQENAGVECARDFLQREMEVDGEHVTAEMKQWVIEAVVYMIENVSFKNELDKLETGAMVAAQESGSNETLDVRTRMLHCVQDSDRLDALGAIGIARCMAFSGAKNRTLYDPNTPLPDRLPTKQEYMSMSADPQMNTAIAHFFVKLFVLKDLMKTRAGRALAEKRTEFMRQYVDQFTQEWNQEV